MWNWKLIQTFVADERGTTAVEYAVILALIMMVCIVSISTVGAGSGGMWGANQTKLNSSNFGK